MSWIRYSATLIKAAADPLPAITGTLAKTEATDTVAAFDVPPARGTLAKTEAADTLTGLAQDPVAGTFAKSEAADGVAGAGTSVIFGTLARPEAREVIATNTGTLVTDAGGDPLRDDSGVLVYQDGGADIVHGGPFISGGLAAIEAVDTGASAAQVTVIGGLTITEAGDSLAGAGTALGLVSDVPVPLDMTHLPIASPRRHRQPAPPRAVDELFRRQRVR